MDIWLDFVPNHTSDRHPWFTEHPEYYVWADEIPNDWTSIFSGKSAWQFDEARGRYYLHQFAVEQPDLDWWNDDVRREFDEILRFWFDRGVAGFRIDVAHGLVKDVRLRNGERFMRDRPEVLEIFARWQKIAREYEPKRILMGETYVSLARLWRYATELDLVQNFDFVRSAFGSARMRSIVDQVEAKLARPLWFGSNHDHSRLATRWAGGDEQKARAALFVLLTLRGDAILYQGDELALTDGAVPPKRITDLAHPPRDPERTPMPWTAGGEEWHDPWLPLTDTTRNVEQQRDDPGSTLNAVRDLIAWRRETGDAPYRSLKGDRRAWRYARGDATCIVDLESWQTEIR
jgi:alpha-glucosidase